MYLFRDVMDKELVDSQGDSMGKVNDLLLEVPPGGLPVVRAVITGHGSLTTVLPSFVARMVERFEEKVLDVETIRPITIGWEHVTHIDVAVHADLNRREAGATETEHTVWERWISRIPWSQR